MEIVAIFIIKSKQNNNYKIPYLFTAYSDSSPNQWKEKEEYENKKMCRARAKSRARDDQNHIIFFNSPMKKVYNSLTTPIPLISWSKYLNIFIWNNEK